MKKCKAKTTKGRDCPSTGIMNGYCVPHWEMRNRIKRKLNGMLPRKY